MNTRSGVVKRSFDLLSASTALLLLSPVILVIALLVWRKIGRPILFRQQRPGFHGRIFTLFKFRTMTDGTDAEGRLLPSDQRLTPFGSWLRATSLDELPELLNVLKGDMSLVGPRPLKVAYLERYDACQARRHEVRPGLTGWAQVNGRNRLSWEEKFRLDVWYVENGSFLLDLKILWLTLLKVASREGISPEDSPVMPEFMGSGEDGDG
jgi:sugar transferase EpsL